MKTVLIIFVVIIGSALLIGYWTHGQEFETQAVERQLWEATTDEWLMEHHEARYWIATHWRWLDSLFATFPEAIDTLRLERAQLEPVMILEGDTLWKLIREK